MTVVRKTAEEGDENNMYPSVNTCAHYIKLPQYKNEAVLKERLLVAISTKGFYMN